MQTAPAPPNPAPPHLKASKTLQPIHLYMFVHECVCVCVCARARFSPLVLVCPLLGECLCASYLTALRSSKKKQDNRLRKMMYQQFPLPS